MKNSDVPEPVTDPSERRSEIRKPPEGCYNAEIKILGYPVYQVKMANISPKGASILVKEGSSLLSLLTVGRILDVRFHSDEQQDPTDAVIQFKAEVKHISDVRARDIDWSGFRCWETNNGSELIPIKPPPQIP